jgi:sugar transferase (PEP-CTERM/EpsH1 system associated)
VRILLLTQRVPYPPNRGDKIPTFHYARHLAKEHEVTVACLAENNEDLKNVQGLSSIVHSVEAVCLSPRRAPLRALMAMAGSRPLTVAYFDEPELRARVRRLVHSGNVDVAIACSSGVAQFVEEFNDLPRVIQFTDLDSQKWQQFAAATRPPQRWVFNTEAQRLLAYERRIAQTFSQSLVCSPREETDFNRLIPGVDVECLPNGVDLDYYHPQDTPKEPAGLIFTGVMNYFPNIDGVEWFCREILPLVQAEVPAATFTICGACPDRSVVKLGQRPGVTVTGAVPDVRPHLSKAAVAVVPLRIARGIQNKLLEAMAMGLPVVTTSAAWNGIDAEPHRDLLVADEPKLFADAVVRLLKDNMLREQVGQAGRSAVEAGYRWEKSLSRLQAIVENAAMKTTNQLASVG